LKKKRPTNGKKGALKVRRSAPIARENSVPIEEAEELVNAIRRGRIDALVMQGTKGEKVVTLQGTDHPYRVLVESINDGAATLDSRGTVLFANNRFAEILNIPPRKLIGSSLQNQLAPGKREELQKLIGQALRRSSGGEITLDTAGGRPKLVRFTLKPLKSSDRHKVCVVATELTELVEANEALKTNEESLRQLSARLLQLQDEERRHIARDLHDVTGQKLAVQSMALSGVLSRHSDKLGPESQKALSEALVMNKEISSEIRTLSYLLHPPLLDELGLSSAANWYAAGFTSRTGIQIDVDIPSDLQRFSADAEVAIFRVLQESLTNVHRYSESSKARIRIHTTPDELKVEIRDFGKGMDAANHPKGSLPRLGVGIQGMTERMRQLGGRLEITSHTDRGTLVEATIPLCTSQAAVAPQPGNGHGSAMPVPRMEILGSPGNDLRKRILIADDHEMLRRGVRDTLQTEPDLEICGEAIDGQDAVEKAKLLRPDLVILDINMPILNGLAAVRQILRNRPQTKVLIFSVHDSNQTLQEIHAAGAHGFVSKGKDAQDLLRVVREVLAVKSVSAVASLAN
jgi:two-component system NarL family sensor kinase